MFTTVNCNIIDSVEEKTAIGAIQYWQQNKAYQMAIEELDEASVG